MNIIALAPNAWNGQWVNRQQLLSRVGRKHNVVYSTGTWFVWDLKSEDFKSSELQGSFLYQDNVAIDIPPRTLLRWPRFRKWDQFVIRVHATRLRRAFPEPSLTIAYICHPMFVPYLGHLKADLIIYHCYDLFDHQPGWSTDLEVAERELLRKADLIFSPTVAISDQLMKKTRCSARVLPNAADTQAIFDALAESTTQPEDLIAIHHPRIGYLGSLHPQIDFELIAKLAQRRPEWQFVLVGPEQNIRALHQLPDYNICRQLPNVHFLGEKHRSLIPAYLIHMDVNALFYRLNTDSWTNFGHPLKLHEYLACGNPIVSAGLPILREFAEIIAFADGVDEWEQSIAEALDLIDDSVRRGICRAIASRNGWEERADVLSSWIAELRA